MSTIFLIRHGKTEANEKHLYCGRNDLPLSSSGAAELRALKRRYPILAQCDFYTSGMRRTEQTLEILFGNVPHRTDARLREIDFGAFEMRSYEELKDDPRYQTWISGDNMANVPPEGESGHAMKKRAAAAFEEILQSGRDAIVVTHGGVIAALMESLFPEERKNRYEWQPRPGFGWRIDIEASLRRAAIPPVVTSFFPLPYVNS